MKLLSLSNDFSFTVNIHEIKDILKDSMYETKNSMLINLFSKMEPPPILKGDE
jgi:hypothetical protein